MYFLIVWGELFLKNFITLQFRIFFIIVFIWRTFWSAYNLSFEYFKEKVYLTGLNILINSPGDTKNKGKGWISLFHRIPFILWLSLIFFLHSKNHHYSQGYSSNTVKTILGTESKACKRTMHFSTIGWWKETTYEYTLCQRNILSIPDAIKKVPLWDNLPCYVCWKTEMKPRFCSWSAPLLLFMFWTVFKISPWFICIWYIIQQSYRKWSWAYQMHGGNKNIS